MNSGIVLGVTGRVEFATPTNKTATASPGDAVAVVSVAGKRRYRPIVRVPDAIRT
jgi:hypothetical protein